jgi:hypothetical protein
MSRTPEIVDFDLIHALRKNGVSFPEIGRRLAVKCKRLTPFQANSIQTAYRRWLDEQGVAPHPVEGDLRHRRRRGQAGTNQFVPCVPD